MAENHKTTAIILDGRAIAKNIKAKLFKQISQAKEKPGLTAILIGDDSASELYVSIKERACEQTGINFNKYLCNKICYPDASELEIITMIQFLNNDNAVDGILIQLPLPAKFNTQKIIDAISPQKDADGFHYGVTRVISPVVGAIMELILAVPNLETNHKKVLAIIKNDTLGSSLKEQLAKIGLANVTQENKIPKNSADYDVIIIALGKSHALKKTMIKNGAIIIDVGINSANGKTTGDVDPEVTTIAGYISPVPGGVGPLTVACLLKNTYQLFKNKNTEDSASV